MTTNEARSQIDACERQITSAYSGLKDNARLVGSSAAQAASSATLTKTLLPLILCLVGLFCFAGPWFLGILLIAGGIFLSYKLHGPAKSVQNQVVNQQRNLNSTIDNNAKI